MERRYRNRTRVRGFTGRCVATPVVGGVARGLLVRLPAVGELGVGVDHLADCEPISRVLKRDRGVRNHRGPAVRLQLRLLLTRKAPLRARGAVVLLTGDSASAAGSQRGPSAELRQRGVSRGSEQG